MSRLISTSRDEQVHALSPFAINAVVRHGSRYGSLAT